MEIRKRGKQANRGRKGHARKPIAPAGGRHKPRSWGTRNSVGPWRHSLVSVIRRQLEKRHTRKPKTSPYETRTRTRNPRISTGLRSRAYCKENAGGVKPAVRGVGRANCDWVRRCAVQKRRFFAAQGKQDCRTRHRAMFWWATAQATAEPRPLAASGGVCRTSSGPGGWGCA